MAIREGWGRAYFATLRCVKMSPGLEAVMTLSGTRESLHPIQSTYNFGQRLRGR